MNTDNVRKLIRLLDEREFDGTWDTPQGSFHYDFGIEYHAGDVCGCHVGLAYAHDLIDFPGDEEIQTFTGLTEEEVDRIFYDADTYECAYGEVTPEMVSRELEKLLIWEKEAELNAAMGQFGSTFRASDL